MTNTVELRTLTDYLKLNYPIVLHVDPDGGYVAEIKDLSGCLTQGESIDRQFSSSRCFLLADRENIARI